jgi:hypothetical protein
MSTKAFQVRVDCDENTRAKLWQLTETFNRYVRLVLLKMLDMRAGRACANQGAADDFKLVFSSITSSQNAIAKMEAIGDPKWSTGKTGNPATREGQQQQASKDAVDYLRIHQLLDDEIQRIGGWIDTHPLDWENHLQSDAQLLQWRNSNTGFVGLDEESRKRIAKAQQPRRTGNQRSNIQAGNNGRDWKSIAADALKKSNPELKALDKARREHRWAAVVQSLHSRRIMFFDKERDLPKFANEFKRKTYEAAFAIIHGHEQKLADWRNRHKEWLAERREFEKENAAYMAVRPQFEEFEKQQAGATGKRRRRWHRYLAFLRSSPALAAWRGNPAVITPIPESGLARIRKARRNKRSATESEEFFKVNPELKALDEQHGRYEEEFVRRQVDRRFLDGFSLPPTLTLPQIPLHPCWYTFKKEVTYKNLEFKPKRRCAEGAMKVQLPFQNAQGKYKWISVCFRGTPRLLRLHNAAEIRIGKDKFTWHYQEPLRARPSKSSDVATGRPAEIKGVKLMFQPPKPNGVPYLAFTVALADRELSEKAKSFKDSSAKIAEGMISCAADLVMRHPHVAAVSVAVATAAEDGTVVPRIVCAGFITAGEIEHSGKHEGRVSRGPSLKHQAIHKQSLRVLRKGSRGAKGMARNRAFQDHVTNMREDACRKNARKLVDFARFGWPQAPADILVVENLKALRADARKERGINAAVINWARGHTAKWAKMCAKTEGLLFREEKAYWTSQVCSRCLRLGRRYTPCRNNESGKLEPRFGTVEKLFACPTPDCPIDVNADINASINLHLRLYGQFPNCRKDGNRIIVAGNSTTYAETESIVLDRLNKEAEWLEMTPGVRLPTEGQVGGRSEDEVPW